jgi:hypothetical protein
MFYLDLNLGRFLIKIKKKLFDHFSKGGTETTLMMQICWTVKYQFGTETMQTWSSVKYRFLFNLTGLERSF